MENMRNKIGLCFCILILAVLSAGNSMADIKIPDSPLNQPISMISLNGSLVQANYLNQDEGTPVVKKKSTTKAVFLSLLLPGAGQLYLGEKTEGEMFIGAEILIWGAFAVFHTLGNWKEDDYIDYAVQHARIDADGKSDGFYDNLVYYESRDEYNESAWIADPTNEPYPMTPEYYWQWDNDESQLKFRDIRNASDENFRKASFMIGAAIVNRIIAGIDTFRIAKKKNRQKAVTEFSNFNIRNIDVDIDANPFGSNPNLSVTLSHRF